MIDEENKIVGLVLMGEIKREADSFSPFHVS
jgi:hypothetical protein